MLGWEIEEIFLDGAKFAGYRTKTKGVVAHRESAAGQKFGVAGSIPICETPVSAAPLVHLSRVSRLLKEKVKTLRQVGLKGLSGVLLWQFLLVSQRFDGVQIGRF